MFEFVKRMLGLDGSAEADLSAGTIATVAVQGRGSSDAPLNPADLTARDSAGTAVLACRVAVVPDPRLVAGLGPARTGGVAAGDYRVDAVLPARLDADGLALFGPLPMLRLRAVEGGATYGLSRRTVLLVHGGPARRPTDGSIRMDDAHLHRLLMLLPPHPSTVVFTLVLPEGDEDEAPACMTDWDEESWTSDTSPLLYEQLYDWTEPPPDAPPYPDPASQVQADQDVSTALAGLGYTVLPDTTAADAEDPSPSGADAPDCGWTPAGGAYDR